MTTERDDLKDRVQRFGSGFVDTQGTNNNGFLDPNKEFPRKKYNNLSSVNEAVRSGETHQLPLGADVDVPPLTATQYPYADIKETVSGHVLEFNDTPGGERILIKHNSGSGIELRPDGTVVVLATDNKVEVTHGDQTVIVEGNGQLTYEGDLTINVKGDFKVNCDNYEVNTKGDKKENIEGNSRSKVFGNKGSNVSGNDSKVVAGESVSTHLGNVTTAIKGTNKQATEGDIIIAGSSKIELTAETRIIQSSPKMNIQALEAYIWADTGTFGGVEVRHHGQGAHFSEGVTAPTFHGDLRGTSLTSLVADISNSQSYADPSTGGGVGSPSGFTVSNVAQPDVYTAASGVLSDVLTKSEIGVKTVKVDVDNFLYNSLRIRKLDTVDVRSKLRDPSYLNDVDFAAIQLGAGRLNEQYTSTTPPGGYGRVRKAGGTAQRGSSKLGNVGIERATKTFIVDNKKKIFSLTDQKFGEIDLLTDVTSTTILNKPVSMARFIGANDAGSFKSLSLADKKQIAKNYLIQTHITKYAMGTSGKFSAYKLKAVEGFYAKELYGKGGAAGLLTETLTAGGLLDLRNKGQAVVYELYGPDGKMDPEVTFDLACNIAEIGLFDKLTLDYDIFNPDGSMNVQIIIETPIVTKPESVTFKRLVQTTFNNSLQSADSLVELEPNPSNTSFNPR
jgi:hypothetical protein